MAVSVVLAKVLDKAWEDKTLQEILDAPVTALAGVSDGDATRRRRPSTSAPCATSAPRSTSPPRGRWSPSPGTRADVLHPAHGDAATTPVASGPGGSATADPVGQPGDR